MDKSSLIDEYPLSQEEAAKYLDLSRQRLVLLARQKKISHLRLGYRLCRFKKADLDAYLENLTVVVKS